MVGAIGLGIFNDTNKPIIRLLMRTFKEDLEKDLRDPEFARIFHKEWRAMTDKKYGDVMVRQEHGQVILSKPSMTKPLIMKRSTFRAIVADNVKSVMKPNDEPEQTVSQILDNGTPWEEV